jgi:nicotinate-nucleotide--dimethylbenzimidazole phosphoribosyltransferase
MAGVFGFDPYDILGCPRLPEIAALVGVAIAGAQMGVPICLPGTLGELVARAALRLNPGVDAWFDPMPAGIAVVGQALAIPCVRCAT